LQNKDSNVINKLLILAGGVTMDFKEKSENVSAIKFIPSMQDP